jgi:hypothetical protein
MRPFVVLVRLFTSRFSQVVRGALSATSVSCFSGGFVAAEVPVSCGTRDDINGIILTIGGGLRVDFVDTGNLRSLPLSWLMSLFSPDPDPNSLRIERFVLQFHLLHL